MRNVSRDNDGIYTCRAIQILGFFDNVQERDIHLNVECNGTLLVFTF